METIYTVNAVIRDAYGFGVGSHSTTEFSQDNQGFSFVTVVDHIGPFADILVYGVDWNAGEGSVSDDAGLRLHQAF